MSCYFTTIFVHRLIVAAVCHFCVYKWIGWDPANIYFFNFNSRDANKRSEICPKLTINTVENRSGVFVVNFEYYSHYFFNVSIVDFE